MTITSHTQLTALVGDKYNWCWLGAMALFVLIFPVSLILWLLYWIGQGAESVDSFLRKPQYRLYYLWQNRKYYRKQALQHSGDK